MDRKSRGPEVMWIGSNVDRKSRGPEVTWTGSHVDRKSRGPEAGSSTGVMLSLSTGSSRHPHGVLS